MAVWAVGDANNCIAIVKSGLCFFYFSLARDNVIMLSLLPACSGNVIANQG